MSSMLGKVDNEFYSLAVVDSICDSKVYDLCKKAVVTCQDLFDLHEFNMSIPELDSLIVNLDELISDCLDAVMHHKNFKALESSWLSLWHLVDSVRGNTIVSIMDVDKTGLQEDLHKSTDIRDSQLYKEVYEFEYNMPGGVPYSFIVADHYYENTSSDISSLKTVSKICASSHCPFISSITSKYLGLEGFEQLYSLESISDYLEQPEFNEVRSLRDMHESKYISLVMPKYIIRKPYGSLNPTTTFNYLECIVNNSSYTWGNSAFLLAKNILNSHTGGNGVVQVQGPGAGGMVTDLPSMGLLPSCATNVFRTASEAMISETTEKKLSEVGIICFSLFKGNDRGCFFSTSSVHKPISCDDPYDMANAKINSHLSYVLLMSRIAHFLKIIHRESIGNVTSKTGLSVELNKWLSALVTKMPDPDVDLVKQRPLKDAKVIVKDIESDPGNFDVDIFVVPHFQLEGVDIKLSLVSKLPKEHN